jgi:hypothetical protein
LLSTSAVKQKNISKEKKKGDFNMISTYELMSHVYSASWFLTIMYAVWQYLTSDKSTKRMITGIIANQWGLYWMMYLLYNGKM